METEEVKNEEIEINVARLRVLEKKEDKYFGNDSLEGYQDEDAENNVNHETENIIRLNNVHKTYLLGIEGVPALRGVSLSIKKGEFICIYGTSGGGKTSLLNILGTIDKPTKGELFINQTRITHNTSDKVLSDLRLRDIGFVFQTFNLLSSLSAIENVEMPMVLDGKKSAKERREHAKHLLSLVGMSHRIDHMPSQLSGGEQQRVTIARAMANNPSLLLLDEPTGDLDTVNTAIVMKLLTNANRDQKITLVMVTHDVSLKYFADRIIWLRDGKIQRIEIVSREKKNETLDKLDADLVSLGISPLSLTSSPKLNADQSDNSLLTDDSLIFDEREHSTLLENTVIRQPTDYRTHPLYNIQTAKKLSNFTKVVN